MSVDSRIDSFEEISISAASSPTPSRLEGFFKTTSFVRESINPNSPSASISLCLFSSSFILSQIKKSECFHIHSSHSVDPLGLEPRLFCTKNRRVANYTMGQ